MPEGPSILHLRNKLLPFKGKTVKEAGGYGKMPTDWIKGKKLLDIQSWGKHLLFVFKNGTVKVHLNLFGSILINERRKVNRKFFLTFSDGEINGYVVQATKLEGKPEDHYDWRTDILSEAFDAGHVKGLMKEKSSQPIADLLMDQDIFTGVGNIIRNEALYLAGIHPMSITGKIPAAKITKLIKSVVSFARNWLNTMETKGKRLTTYVYHKDYDPDGSDITMKVLPKTKRKIYYSEHKQHLYE